MSGSVISPVAYSTATSQNSYYYIKNVALAPLGDLHGKRVCPNVSEVRLRFIGVGVQNQGTFTIRDGHRDLSPVLTQVLSNEQSWYAKEANPQDLISTTGSLRVE
jgi:hypothetical protein